MNTRRVQFNRQWAVPLLFAGLILALALGLAWAGIGTSGSTLQPAKLAQHCAYSPQPGHTGLSAAEVDCPGAALGGDESRSLPWSSLKSVKSGSGGIGGGDFRK